MEIRGGGIEALQAYSQAAQVKRNSPEQEATKAQETRQNHEAQAANHNQASTENRPIAGGSVGSIINTSA